MSCLPKTREKTSLYQPHAISETLGAHPRGFLWLFPGIVSPILPRSRTLGAHGPRVPSLQSSLLVMGKMIAMGFLGANSLCRGDPISFTRMYGSPHARCRKARAFACNLH